MVEDKKRGTDGTKEAVEISVQANFVAELHVSDPSKWSNVLTWLHGKTARNSVSKQDGRHCPSEGKNVELKGTIVYTLTTFI